MVCSERHSDDGMSESFGACCLVTNIFDSGAARDVSIIARSATNPGMSLKVNIVV